MSLGNKVASLLEPPQKFVPKYNESEVKALGKLLVDCLKEHNCPCEIKSGRCGRVSTIFEIVPQSGVKVKQIEDREEDIALRLGVSSAACRSENGLLLVEIPNGDVKAVKIGELLLGGEYPLKNKGLLVVIGRLVTGEAVFLDIAATPHTLIAGSTGSGKSVCVHAIISNLLLTKSPRELRLILIDPKRTELKRYNSVPHLLCDVIYETDKIVNDSVRAVQGAVKEMYRRLDLIEKTEAENISSYNAMMREEGRPSLPRIVIVFEEFETLMDMAGDASKTKETKKLKDDLELGIKTLARLGRAAGIHLILATQRPAAENVSKNIRDNLPQRICFKVLDSISSKVVLGQTQGCAEKLQGNGDFLMTVSNVNALSISGNGAALKGKTILHGQCVLITMPEVKNIVQYSAGKYSNIRRLSSYEGSWNVEDLMVDFTEKEDAVDDLLSAPSLPPEDAELSAGDVSLDEDKVMAESSLDAPDSEAEEDSAPVEKEKKPAKADSAKAPVQKEKKTPRSEPADDLAQENEARPVQVEKADLIIAPQVTPAARAKAPAEEHNVGSSIYQPPQKKTIITGYVDICGERYKTVRIGAQKWLAENLRFNCNGMVSKELKIGSICWSECYYSWEVASQIKGKWRVPTVEDWQKLHDFIARKSKRPVGANLKSKEFWKECGNVEKGLDAFGFSALPVGYVDSRNGKLVYLSEASCFWVASEDDPKKCYVRTLDWASSVFGLKKVNAGCAASIRLVCDVED